MSPWNQCGEMTERENEMTPAMQTYIHTYIHTYVHTYQTVRIPRTHTHTHARTRMHASISCEYFMPTAISSVCTTITTAVIVITATSSPLLLLPFCSQKGAALQQRQKETAAEATEATELEMVKAKLKKTQEAIKDSGFSVPVDVDGYL